VSNTRTVRYKPENNTFFISINFSLFHNKQPLTYDAVTDFGVYFKHGVFSVRYKLNVMWTC